MKLKPTTKAILAVTAVIIVVGVIIAVNYLDLGLPELPFNIGGGSDSDSNCMEIPDSSIKISMSNFEIFSVLEQVTGRDLNFTTTDAYIDTLHAEVFGTDTVSAYPMLEWFESEMAADGWSPADEVDVRTGPNWVAYIEFWTRGDQAKGVIIGEGAAVSVSYGYTTVFMTSCGPATTYEQFMAGI